MSRYTTEITLEHDGPVSERQAEDLLDRFGRDGTGIESTEGSSIVRIGLAAETETLEQAGRHWDELARQAVENEPGWTIKGATGIVKAS